MAAIRHCMYQGWAVKPVQLYRMMSGKPWWIRKKEEENEKEMGKKTHKETDATPVIVKYLANAIANQGGKNCQKHELSIHSFLTKDELMKELGELEYDIVARQNRAVLLPDERSTDEIYDALKEIDGVEMDDVDQNEDNSDYLETFTFESPSQTKRKKKEVPTIVGTPDPSVPLSDVPCGGCGALLHCKDHGIPGYIVSEKFKSFSREELRKSLCQRCFLLTHHNLCLDASVSEYKYHNIIRQIKNDQALILMVVDLLDIENSIVRNFIPMIGKNRPLYIIGNKVDLIPRDDTGYLERVKTLLRDSCERAGLNPTGENVKHICLVSAKTGYGIEDLITHLMKHWKMNGDVYLVGNTNSGKSSIFNALIQSDYCRDKARETLHRATVSIWPGTTISLLKFPILTPTSYIIAKRLQRLHELRPIVQQEEELKKQRLQMYGRSKNATLIGYVGITDFRSDEEIQKEMENPMRNLEWAGFKFQASSDQVVNSGTEKVSKIGTFNEKKYLNSKWFFDTPGVIDERQIINLLTQEELLHILPKGLVRPRVFLIKPGEVMFVSGLARLDYLEGKTVTLFTVHTSWVVPVHVVRAEEADDFYRKNIGTETLQVPIGDESRLGKLPSLVGREFKIRGEFEKAAADIQLSSLGWVSILLPSGITGHIRVFIPGRIGCYLRQPPLLPNVKAFRGRRIRGTPEYQLKKLKA
ncbi:hypothetical protein ACJMK2_005758 [Sinanodonta woodiana]|uniref:G domain-containing protein n=1 Tax=Sinanodonta woodiana TaxID=1069815 RepID=A0ABD3VRF7_SINWO